jgi:hypothetical protein
MNFIVTILGILLDAAKQLLTWKEAWIVLGPALLIFVAFVVYKMRKRRTARTRRNNRRGNRQPVDDSNWMRKMIFASLIICLCIGGVYALTNRSDKITIQYVQTTSDQNGEERVAVESIEDIMKTDFAESNQFEVASSGGEYSVQVKLGGATPRILIFLTGTDKVVGGGALEVPYHKGQNVAEISHELSRIVMDSVKHRKGLKGVEARSEKLKLPPQTQNQESSVSTSPQRKATKK